MAPSDALPMDAAKWKERVQQLRCGTHACMGPDERCLHVDHQDAAWQSESAECLDPQGEEGPESAVRGRTHEAQERAMSRGCSDSKRNCCSLPALEG